MATAFFTNIVRAFARMIRPRMIASYAIILIGPVVFAVLSARLIVVPLGGLQAASLEEQKAKLFHEVRSSNVPDSVQDMMRWLIGVIQNIEVIGLNVGLTAAIVSVALMIYNESCRLIAPGWHTKELSRYRDKVLAISAMGVGLITLFVIWM